MRFRQTSEHDPGNGSHHKVGVFLGQLRGEIDDLDELLSAVSQTGADGVELDTWKLPLDRATTEEGAAALAQQLFDQCGNHALDIFSLAVHLQGQVLGDEAGAETLNFMGGLALETYVDWRHKHSPPRHDPFYVPDHVAELMRSQAAEQLRASGRLASALGKLQNRRVPLSGFTGAPCRLWRHWFPFPPIPTKLGSVALFDGDETLVDRSYAVLLERFGPIWEFYRQLPGEIHFGLEVHPSEIAMGDLHSAAVFLERVRRAGHSNVGFNYDPSHMAWQDVDPVAFIREFGQDIWSVHFKGVTLRSERSRFTRGGRLGGFLRFGHPDRDMDFVFAGSPMDICPAYEIVLALNEAGYAGALTIEAEDTGVGLIDGLETAIASLRAIDGTPSKGAFDAAFAAEE